MDVLALVKRRPIILAAGAAVGLAAWQYLAGGDTSPAAEGDATTGDGTGSSYLPGGSGSIGYDYPSVPGNGELGDSGVITTPPPVTPPPAAPKTAYLVAIVPPGDHPTFGYSTTKSGAQCSTRTGTLKTSGFERECVFEGSRPKCEGSGTRSLYRILDGPHAGRRLAATSINVQTRYR